MKSANRSSKANGSTKRRVETIIRNGWQPGLRPSDYYDSKSRRTRREAGSRAVA